MIDNRETTADTFRVFAEFVSQTQEKDLVALVRGDARLKIVYSDVAEMKSGHGTDGALTECITTKRTGDREVTEYRRVVNELENLSSREEAVDLLAKKFDSKRALKLLSRHLDLPVQRDDTLPRIRDRIVEYVIGSRLRSDAIQGKTPQ